MCFKLKYNAVDNNLKYDERLNWLMRINVASTFLIFENALNYSLN